MFQDVGLVAADRNPQKRRKVRLTDVGANALVGGRDRSLALQPLSGEAQSGLALAAGVASLTLLPE